MIKQSRWAAQCPMSRCGDRWVESAATGVHQRILVAVGPAAPARPGRTAAGSVITYRPTTYEIAPVAVDALQEGQSRSVFALVFEHGVARAEATGSRFLPVGCQDRPDRQVVPTAVDPAIVAQRSLVRETGLLCGPLRCHV